MLKMARFISGFTLAVGAISLAQPRLLWTLQRLPVTNSQAST